MPLQTLAKFLQHIPKIMDGYGLLAQKRHMPRAVGHAKDTAGVQALIEQCAKLCVKYFTLFTSSTKNFSRPGDKVFSLMGLFVHYLEKEMAVLAVPRESTTVAIDERN